MPCLQQRKTPRRLTSWTRCQASNVVSIAELSSVGLMPALLKSTSIRPSSALARSYISRTCCSSLTSATSASSPSAPKRRADSAPIPLAAPVITQTLPSRRPGIRSLPPCQRVPGGAPDRAGRGRRARSVLAAHERPRTKGCEGSGASSRCAVMRGWSSTFLRLEVDVLDLGVGVERVGAELAAEARLLEAAERGRDPHRGVVVDREHAGVDRPRHAQGTGAVAGPDRAREAVDRVVCDPHRLLLAPEGDHAGDRPEDLLAGRAL